MKVLIPTADYPPIEGGISSVTLNVSRTLAALGHDVVVVAPHFPGQDAFDRAEPVRVVRYHGYNLGWARFFPMLAAAWPHVDWADLVLGINIASGGMVGFMAMRQRRKPYVAFAYAYEFLKFRNNPLAAAFLRRLYANACLTVAISAYTRDRLLEFGAPPDRVNIIFPGAPPPVPLSPDALAAARDKFALDTPHVILGVGRFIPRKGQITLVRAMPAILERFPDTVLVLVGRGPCMGDCVREAANLGVRNNTLFPGAIPDADVAALYALCEVFALPTGQDDRGQVEGFGLVFTEAQAYGKPVVAGRSGGVTDAVIHRETGLVVEPDNPESLADAILSLMENPTLAKVLGETARRRVETELNWDHFTRTLIEAACRNSGLVNQERQP